jgi:O-6-methylguanine DNA methyltransferase
MKWSEFEFQAPPGLKEQTLIDTGLIDGFVSLASPVGMLNIAFNTRGISAVAPPEYEFVAGFERRFGRRVVAVDRLPNQLEVRVKRTLETGRLAKLPVDWRGQTNFQRAVLEAASSIPTGEVRPYGWIAARIGRPAAVRAVGSALGQNPVPVIVACHRVVRTDGTLGQYRFGAAMKAELLKAEGLDFRPYPGVLVGDKRTGVACYPSCRVARRTAPRYQHWLGSARQAIAAEYIACERCRPLLGD